MNSYYERFFTDNFCNAKPFFFRYNGAEAPANFGPLTEVEDSGAAKAGYRLFESVMEQPDGFRAVLQVKAYEASSAIEWQLILENTGEWDSNLVSEIRYCDVAVAPDVKPDGGNCEWPILYYTKGSQVQKDDFMMEMTNIYPEWGRHYVFHCASGRSSSEYMPYFNLQMSVNAGVILAIGWSGTWKAELYMRAGDPERTMLAKVTFPDACFRLHPGEKIALPSMLAMPWCFPAREADPEKDRFIHSDCIGGEAAFDRSFNQFRRFIYQFMLPKIDGKPIEGKICLRAWGGIPMEAHMRKIENIRKHQLPGELYAIDAGWYGKDWHQDAGDWNAMPSHYPNGLKELVDAAAEVGLDFSAWLELERAGAETENVKANRDYYLGRTYRRGAYVPMPQYDMGYGLLLNFGYEPARQWIKEKVAQIIRENNMKIFRIDYNVVPAGYWHYTDTADRKGITELKYINGLYQTFDELLEMFPDVIIDNCAGGGRRLDYAMGKRSIPVMCRSDYFTRRDYKPEGVQAHVYALSRWLPVHGDSAGSCTGASALSMDTYKFRSSIASGIGVPIPEREMSGEEAAWYRKMIQDAFRVRPYACKDFYPLTGHTLSLKDWMAYRFHDYDTGNGVILAFRREESAGEKYTFTLTEGIEYDAEYEIEDIDSGVLQTVSGKQLAEKGIPVEITEKRASRIVFYTKIS